MRGIRTQAMQMHTMLTRQPGRFSILLLVAVVAIGLVDAAAQTTGDGTPDANAERSEAAEQSPPAQQSSPTEQLLPTQESPPVPPAEQSPPAPPADTTRGRSIIVRIPVGDSTPDSTPDSTRIDTIRVRSPRPRTTLNQPKLRRRHSMDVKIAEVRRDTVFLPVLEHLRDERFDAARELLDSIGRQARDATVRKVAAFDRVEIDFFAGDFTTAREGYKAFGRSHKRGYLANDALARVFLIDDNSDRMQAPLRLFARAELFSRVGAVDSAMSICQATLTRFPDCELRDELNLRLGDLSLQTAEPGDALHFYRTVCDTIPDSSLGATALMRIGHYHEVIERDIPAAIQVYEDVLERYPESLETPEARKILDGLRQRTVVPMRGRTEKET